jgi:hypothetical protein
VRAQRACPPLGGAGAPAFRLAAADGKAASYIEIATTWPGDVLHKDA